MEEVKVYGLCLGRLKHQVHIAKERLCRDRDGQGEWMLLESYTTAEPEELIEILELYDLNDRGLDALWEKLGELAETASLLSREGLRFGYTDEGHFGLFLLVRPAVEAPFDGSTVLLQEVSSA